MRGGERITAKLELTCQPPDRQVGPTVQVAGLPDLTPPKIREPIRVFYRAIFIDNVVPGANVHVFINGKWRAQELVKQYGGFVYVDVGTLKVEDKITAVQSLCTKFSPHSLSVNVVPGKMLLSVQPTSLVQGQAASLKITARDAESPTFPVAATVSLGGRVIGATNVPFTITAPVGAPTVNLSVAANGYNTETLSIPLTPPVVVKPAMLTIISLSFNASKKVINEITWNLLGPSASFSKNEKPNMNPASVQFALLPPPGGGFTSFTLSGLVSFEYENFNFIPGANGKRTSNFIQGGFIKPSPSTLGLQWNGSDMTINLVVDWIMATDEFIILVF